MSQSEAKSRFDFCNTPYARTALVTGSSPNRSPSNRLSAEWRPNDRFSLRLAGDLANDNSNARHGHREAAGSGLATGETVLGRLGAGTFKPVRAERTSLSGAPIETLDCAAGVTISVAPRAWTRVVIYPA